MICNKSEQLFAEALKYIPGGVNSPVRSPLEETFLWK
jgi:glutamate-1-semialdehyde aminotransferase